MSFPGHERRAVALLALTAFLWAISFPLIRVLSLAQHQHSPEISSWFVSSVIVTSRFLLGGLVVALLSPRSLQAITRSEWSQGLGLGLLCGISILWQVDGLSYSPASVSAFITQGYCVWIPIYVCLRSRRVPSGDLLISTGLVVAGIFLLSGASFDSLHLGRGELETLLASLFCAAQILWLERPRFEDNRSLTITVIMFFAAGLVAAPVALVSSGGPGAWTQLLQLPHLTELMVVLTLVCTVAPFLLMNQFQKFVTATEAGLIYCCEPIFASLLALFLPGILAGWMGTHYPNETPTAPLLLGGGLITAANIWIQVRKGSSPVRAANVGPA
ncbi:MAG: DMT family transporter [Myxococcota bacterium]